MNPEETKKAADQWLNEALDGYSATEPRVGLDTRILANLQARAAQRRRRWMYAFAGAAAVMLFAVVMANVRGTQRHVRNNAALHVATPEQATHRSAANVATQVGKPEIQLGRQRHAPAHGNLANSRAVPQAADVRQEQLSAAKQLSTQQPPLQNDLASTSQQEPRIAIAQQRPVPDIYLSGLHTIQPIEITELPTMKNRD